MINQISKTYRIIINLIDNPITISFAFASLTIPFYFYALLPFFEWLNVTPNDYDNIQKFIEWFGVPYGLLQALVLVNVWTQYDTTERAFDRESDAILLLYNTLGLIPSKKRGKSVVTHIRDYIQHVKDHYLDEYQEDRKEDRRHGDELLNKIRERIGVLIYRKHDKVITAELLRLINELIDDRGDRLAYSKQRMPIPVLSLSIVASILWLGPFFALQFGNFLIKSFFIGGVTFIVVSILLVVYDLDYPFSGTWYIELDSWDDLLEKVK